MASWGLNPEWMQHVLDGFFRKEPDMSASYGYEIVVLEEKNEDGKVVREPVQLFAIPSGLMDEPSREQLLFKHHALLEENNLEPKHVEVHITRPFRG